MIYEYRCPCCDRMTELITNGFRQPKTAKCVHCGARARRVISVCDFHLKGLGWTDGCDGGVGEAPTATNHKTVRNERTVK
ncbi:MAG: zinc ribbon domain-containing protein [Deltaproteobacteria bacterium]|nr:zinc ribbon domain-containing protein [Deltaproteobacteria bacterium]